nr:hypothetical protein [Tanacetum cinerariifolium]
MPVAAYLHMSQSALLTICIPTYNRASIATTVQALLPQLRPEVQLKIFDNCSDIPVTEILREHLVDNISIVRNSINVGAAGNILKCFEYCETEWMWLLSDDDKVVSSAIDNILSTIKQHPDVAYIKFNSDVGDIAFDVKEEVVATGQKDFINKANNFGNILFLSSAVYNVQEIRKGIKAAYYFTPTFSPHVIFTLAYLAINPTGKTLFSPASAIIGGTWVIEDKNWHPIVKQKVLPSSKAYSVLYDGWNFITMSTVMLRREVLIKNRIEFNNQLHYLVDWAMWLQVSMFSDFYYIDKPLVSYRRHNANETGLMNSAVVYNELLALKVSLHSLFPSVSGDLDAGRTGAPIVLLHLLRWLKSHSDFEFEVLLQQGGELEDEFRQVAKTYIWELQPAAGIWQNRWQRLINKQTVYHQDLLKKIKSFNPHVIYANTIVAATLGETLKQLISCPLICHVHELATVIEGFIGKEKFTQLSKNIDFFIAASDAVAVNLHKTHQVPLKSIYKVYEFVPALDAENFIDARLRIRQELGLAENAFVVAGAGSIDWRKAPDLFIQVAQHVCAADSTRTEFIWVGGSLDSSDGQKVRHDVVHAGVSGCVHFLGNAVNANVPLPVARSDSITLIP